MTQPFRHEIAVAYMNPDIEKRIAELANLWSMPDLASSVSLRFSPRLKRTLGRADGTTGRIVLAAFLEDDPTLCDVALCHELAHLAAFRLVGSSERPHGPTWQRLVREAGCPSALRLAIEGAAEERSATRKPTHYRHYCPICHFSRMAGHRMTAWRCADCVAAGLDGRLEIVPVDRSR
jgi:predicted SprT family Zn-dependent metalloprotease